MDYAAALKLKAEYARLCSLTSFQRANERAAKTKAAAWKAYRPFTPNQLYDTLEGPDMVTLVCTRYDGELTLAGRKRRMLHADSVEQFDKHLLTIRRPTEMRAVAHALGFLTLESDFVVVRQEPFQELRWCIYHKTHHIVTDFVPSKRYLNGLSYACRKAKHESNLLFWSRAS